MAIYAISDLHLSLGTDKPMDIFGSHWEDYENKLRENWRRLVQDDDIVLINGDVSWAMYLQNIYEDFAYINALTGKKILSKGNHDYWWTTHKSQSDYCASNGFTTINFLQNNHYMVGDIAICGTRGWALTKNNDEDKKIHNRELERLKLSLSSAEKDSPREIIAALHYPPDRAFKEILTNHRVSTCVYGHLHGNSYRHDGYTKDEIIDGVSYRLVSCDYLNFTPLKIN